MSSPSHSAAPPPATSAAGRWWAIWLATGLGAGYGPVMPGTYGSALGVGLYLLLAALLKPFAHPRLLLAAAALVITAISIKIISIALRSFTAKDPQQIVLDEVVGQMVTLLPLPVIGERRLWYWMAVVVGFLLFRALDAAKPYPIWKLERLKGSWGVVCDDLGAGILGAVILIGLHWLGWKM